MKTAVRTDATAEALGEILAELRRLREPLGADELGKTRRLIEGELIEAFWPGALSLVVRQAPSLSWDLGDTNGSVMLRMPLHPVAIELLREVGPMAVSSANISGQPPAVNADEARDQLGDKVEVYLDAGPATKQAASTIVDLTGATPRVLREGPISVAQIAEVLGVEAESLTGEVP